MALFVNYDQPKSTFLTTTHPPVLVTDLLKKATLPAHQQLEKWMVYTIKSIHTAGQYQSLLSLFYGFYRPVEQQVLPLVRGIVTDLDERRQSDRLWQDLQALDPSIGAVPLCTQVPVYATPGEALGALYVFEGSTLGGAIITNLVHDRVPDLPAGALQFFTGYAEATMVKWAQFRQYLLTFADTDARQQAVLAGANRTFESFYEWLKDHSLTHSK